MSSVAVRISLTVRDEQFQRLMNSARFVPVFNQRMSQQFLNVGETAKRFISREITGGGNTAYTELGVWRYIKGNDSVLFNTGALSNGFTFKFTRGVNQAVVGIRVMPTGKHGPSGLQMSKLVEILHYGASWEPTVAERIALAIKAREADAPPPEGAKKDVWTIPPRPFMRYALMTPEFMGVVQRAASTALTQTFRELLGRST